MPLLPKLTQNPKSCLTITAEVLLAVVIAAAATITVLPHLLDLDAWRPQILSAAQEALGRRVSYESVALTLRPAPALDFRRITIAEKTGDTPFARVERLQFKLAILPLLHREVHLRELVIDQPVITLNRNRDGVFSVDDLFRVTPSAIKLHLGGLRVHNGTLRFTDYLADPAGLGTLLEKMELSISSLIRSRAFSGLRTVLVTPGLDSLAQSNFLVQYLHCILHAGATGRWILPNL